MNKRERQFIEIVWKHYNRHGRRSLPWRKTKNPYHILVSEVMCQQTQVERAIPKYYIFLQTFPTVRDLAIASLGDVLRVWQGLGYNRRAKMLHTCAHEVMGTFHGIFPKTYNGLLLLPGIGPYTAGAIMAFAYNEAVPVIETNIRTVYLFHFFKNKINVLDRDILQKVETTLDINNPKEWYSALMDYGSCLKKAYGNENWRSKEYVKQSKFKGSDRQIRGAILRRLAESDATKKMLISDLTFDLQRITVQLDKLKSEGLLVKCQTQFRLP